MRGKLDEAEAPPESPTGSRALAGASAWLVPENRTGGDGAVFALRHSLDPSGRRISVVDTTRGDS